MTTHRRAWMTRAGVVVALAASALVAAPATPALAVNPTVQITGLPSSTLAPGQRVTLTYRITNNNEKTVGLGNNDDTFSINVSSSFPELKCASGCDPTETIKRGESRDFSATLVAGNVPAGESKSGKVRVSAQAGGDSGSAERDITVKSQASPMVKSISGMVTDIDTGKGIAGATVAMKDSQGHGYSTTTSSSGAYKFTASEGNPISPGEILIAAQADDYNQSETRRFNGTAGQSVTAPRLALKSTKAASPSASPAQSEEPATEESAGTEETTGPAQGAPATKNASDSGGFGSWLLIIVGGLLVALGVGAIVLLLVRRKDNEGDEEDADGAPGSRAGAAGYRGGNDPTRIGSPADATMVTGGALADAPTMLHSIPPIDDEFPDPYGAPLPPAQPGGPQPPYGGGYGSADATSVYGGGAPTQAGYGTGDATSVYGGGPAGGSYGNAPSSGGGYGAPASGGGYGAPAGGPPGGPGGAYGAPPPPGGGYGNAPSSGGGYGGPGNAYGNSPSSGGGYGASGRPAGGEGHGGHDYGQPAGQPGPGYGAPQGGYGERYDEPTGRYEGGANAYGRSSGAYEPGPYGPDGEQGRGGYDGGYGGQSGGYGQGGGGYDPGAGYGAAPGGYGAGYGGAPNGYDQRGGYDGPGGQARVPEQRGGYGERGYDQGGYYDDQAPAAGQSRHGAPQQPSRSERRSLGWLDD